MTGRITDAYTNIATVKLFSHARREAGFARAAMSEFLHTVHRQMRLVTGFEIVNHVLSMRADREHRRRRALAVDARAGRHRRGGGGDGDGAAPQRHLALGDVGNGGAVRAHRHGAGRHQHARAAPQRRRPSRRARRWPSPRGEIRFENVRFAYGGRKAVIDDLVLAIRPGEKIGLVGRSGAGKSTIVNLLLRFYDTEAGRILIDGQDIAAVTQESLRAQIGMVTQDTSLLHRSVRDNMLYGRPDATDGDMIAAARARRGARVHRAAGRPQGPQRLRRPRRRAGRQALRRPAPAHRDRPGDAEGRADPAAGRGHQRARLRGRGGDPAQPLPADGGQDGDRHRAPAVDDRGDGPADRASTAAASSRRAITAACSRRAGSTRGCGRTRAAASSARMPTRQRRPKSTPRRMRRSKRPRLPTKPCPCRRSFAERLKSSAVAPIGPGKLRLVLRSGARTTACNSL